jgi:thymidylate kinase
MTYIILEGSHGSGKTTLAGQVQRSPGVFAIPSLFLDVAVRRSMPGGPRSAFHCNDAIKALLAYEAQASGSDIVQDRGYLSTLAHVAFEDSVQVDTPALPGALTWIDAALDLGLLSMPDHVVVLQISARDARRRILGRDGGLWLANGELEFMEGFFTDLPTWFVERAAPPGCLHVVDWRRGMDVVAGLLDGAPTGHGSGQSGGLRSWQ